jgi:hypothetical protein
MRTPTVVNAILAASQVGIGQMADVEAGAGRQAGQRRKPGPDPPSARPPIAIAQIQREFADRDPRVNLERPGPSPALAEVAPAQE